MENGYSDGVTVEKQREESQLAIVNLHLGTNLEYRPQPAVMDTV